MSFVFIPLLNVNKKNMNLKKIRFLEKKIKNAQ